MSKAKSYIKKNGDVLWFNKDGITSATLEHLEALAEIEEEGDLDEVLEEELSQKEVLRRIHIAEEMIPFDVLQKRKEKWLAKREPVVCRICSGKGDECEGVMTRHHFVPRWLMRELSHYSMYAARSKCTIPICLGTHRRLHLRDGTPKSIYNYLNLEEKNLVNKMISSLIRERPAIFELLLGGDSTSYESQLVYDYLANRFASS